MVPLIETERLKYFRRRRQKIRSKVLFLGVWQGFQIQPKGLAWLLKLPKRPMPH